MTFSIRKTGAWAAPSTVKRRSAGAWATVQAIKRRSAGAWVTVWTAFSASVSPLSSFKSTTLASATLTSGAFTCTPTGGSGAISYAWQYVSGDTTVTCASPSAATTTFSAAVSGAVPDKSAVWRCRVTDAASNVAYSNTITAQFSKI